MRFPGGKVFPIPSNGQLQINRSELPIGKYYLEILESYSGKHLSISQPIEAPMSFVGQTMQSVANTSQLVSADGVFDLSSGQQIMGFGLSSGEAVAFPSPDADSLWVFTTSFSAPSLRQIALPSKELIGEIPLPAGTPLRGFSPHPANPNWVFGYESGTNLRAWYKFQPVAATVQTGLQIGVVSHANFTGSGKLAVMSSTGAFHCDIAADGPAMQCTKVGEFYQNTILMTDRRLVAGVGPLSYFAVFDYRGSSPSRLVDGRIRYWCLPGSDYVFSDGMVLDQDSFEPIRRANSKSEFPIPQWLPSRWREIPIYMNSFSWLRARPSFSREAILNSASLQQTPLSFGSIMTIYGQNLGPEEAGGPFWISPSEIGIWGRGTQVIIEGKAAPVLYVSRNQINFLVPDSVIGKSSAIVQISYMGLVSPPVLVPVATQVPGLFHYRVQANSYAVALDSQSQLVTTTNPVRPGSTVVFFGSGFASPRGLNPAQLVLRADALSVAVSAFVGGRPAVIQYAGGSPGQIAALTQFNVVIPADSPKGPLVPVTFQIAGVSSTAVAISIQ